ncbi:hypothetical protein FA13DRAFT_1818751 [Coprinellus micaceus]|uniref:DUF6699 domain-containing protein n=1 Tax=Coprinellus micaceus TaxID=71717 RepID=A0A4Y7SMR8_COPMI|nr:hypothetical protein FA13DRAFT_1818751 [Coprinellus micaceus]
MPYHHPISASSSASSSLMDDGSRRLDGLALPHPRPFLVVQQSTQRLRIVPWVPLHMTRPPPTRARRRPVIPRTTPSVLLHLTTGNPHTAPFLYPLKAHQPTVDRILRYHRVPAIIWNILSPVHNAQCPSRPTAHWRAAWASSPARRSLDIRTSFIDRPIVVFSGAQTLVTIGDVLEAISRAIRLVDRGRLSLAGQIQGDAVRPADSRPVIGLGLADHQTDQGGGAPTRDGDSARAIMWGGLVQSRTESEVWILATYQA